MCTSRAVNVLESKQMCGSSHHQSASQPTSQPFTVDVTRALNFHFRHKYKENLSLIIDH